MSCADTGHGVVVQSNESLVNTEFSIVDLSGRTFKTKIIDRSQKQVQIDVQQLNAGSYILKCKDGAEVSLKFLKE